MAFGTAIWPSDLCEVLQSGNKTIMQIGSHVGNSPDDLIFHNTHESNRLILVEPVPYLFEQLKKNYTQELPNGNITFINEAITDSIGEVDMYSIAEHQTHYWWHTQDTFDEEIGNWVEVEKAPSDVSQLSSLHKDFLSAEVESGKEAWPNYEDLVIDKIKVKTTTINEVINKYEIKELDLLQIDAECHDYTILMNLNFEIKPKIIVFEDNCLSREQYDLLMKRFSSHGYGSHRDLDGNSIIELG